MSSATGRAILRALIDGDRTPTETARLARGALRKKGLHWNSEALGGQLADHHRLLLTIQLARVEAAEADIADIDKEIAGRFARL